MGKYKISGYSRFSSVKFVTLILVRYFTPAEIPIVAKKTDRKTDFIKYQEKCSIRWLTINLAPTFARSSHEKIWIFLEISRIRRTNAKQKNGGARTIDRQKKKNNKRRQCEWRTEQDGRWICLPEDKRNEVLVALRWWELQVRKLMASRLKKLATAGRIETMRCLCCYLHFSILFFSRLWIFYKPRRHECQVKWSTIQF